MTIREMQYAIQGAIDGGMVSDNAELVYAVQGENPPAFYEVETAEDGKPTMTPLIPSGELAEINLGIQETAVVLGLSPLQVCQLNEIGEQIQEGYESFEGIEDSLSRAERIYLKAWIKTYGDKG